MTQSTSLTPESVQLLQLIFGASWEEAWVCWKSNMKGKRVWDLKPGDLPSNEDCYFCIALLRNGGRLNENAVSVHALVIDDIGTKLDADHFKMFTPWPDWSVETSPGNFQSGYIIKDGCTVDQYRALRVAMKTNPIWGHSDGSDPVHLFRLPQGANTKYNPPWVLTPIWLASSKQEPKTYEELLVLFSGPQGSGGAQGSASSTWTLGLQALRELVDLIPHPPSTTRETWVAVVHGIAGAGGGFDIWDAWSSRWDRYDAADTRRTWDTLRAEDIRSKGGNLRAMAENADAEAFVKWRNRWEAAAVFDDGVEPPPPGAAAAVARMLTPDDFRSVVGETDFINVGTGAFWKPASVDANVLPVVIGHKPDGTPITMKATAWMRTHRYVTELSWLPGLPRIITGKAMGVMGLEDKALHWIFNLYRAPAMVPVAAVNADPWCDLVRKLWPYEASEIFDWFAHRVQRPGEKVNHALVLGGAPGIGKDTVLEAVRRAVGVGNCNEIMPSDLRGGFNDYIKSVLLVINELRDDETVSQYSFYEKSKTLIAAPPYVMTVNSKYLKKYVVPNVTGVVMTTNHKVLGLYLPVDDRRHLVCWSDEEAIAAGDAGFKALWAWLEGGGFDHVAAWLRARDLSGFDCKAPPRKTQAFHDIADAGGSLGETALKGKLEEMGTPSTFMLKDLKPATFDDDADGALNTLLNEPRYRKVLAEVLGKTGYRKVQNPTRKDGRWKIGGCPETIYGRRDISDKELRALAEKLGAVTDDKGGNA